MKKFLYLIIPILIGIFALIGINKYLDVQINKMLSTKDLNSLRREYSCDIKDKGELVNNYLLSENEIMLLGSSELSLSVKKQHITSYFNEGLTRDKLFTVGRPYSQGLQQALAIGSLNPNTIKDKKVVMLVSLQAFLSKGGMPKKAFQSRFSPSQFYAFLDNDKINNEEKIEMAKRVSRLLSGTRDFKEEKLYAKIYSTDNLKSKIEKVLFYPYFIFRKGEVKLKEKGEVYTYLKSLPEKQDINNKEVRKIDWNKEDKIAIKDAKLRTNENKYKIDNEYYEKILKDRLKKMKGAYKNVQLLNSKELDDYIQFLDVSKSLGIKPLIIIMPNSDWYYNYTGLTKEKRDLFYDTIDKYAKEKGFEVVNLKNKENTDYYLKDIMHLGTRGWVDISEIIYNKYDEQLAN